MEAETAAEAASATPRREEGANQGQWAPRDTLGLRACRDSQDCRAAKVTRVKEGHPGSQDRKETWEREVFLDSQVPTAFPDTLGKVGPEDHLATTAATGPEETWAGRDPRVLRASSALLGPKDPKGRKASHMRYPVWTATNTGVNLESLDWLVSRVLLAALGL